MRVNLLGFLILDCEAYSRQSLGGGLWNHESEETLS